MSRIQEFCVGDGLFSDVLFQLEDGVCPAHRSLLVSRSDVMLAMFSGDFRESNATVVSITSSR